MSTLFFFFGWLLSLSIMSMKFIHHVSVVCFYLLLNSIPFDKYTTLSGNENLDYVLF